MLEALEAPVGALVVMAVSPPTPTWLRDNGYRYRSAANATAASMPMPPCRSRRSRTRPCTCTRWSRPTPTKCALLLASRRRAPCESTTLSLPARRLDANPAERSRRLALPDRAEAGEPSRSRQDGISGRPADETDARLVAATDVEAVFRRELGDLAHVIASRQPSDAAFRSPDRTRWSATTLIAACSSTEVRRACRRKPLIRKLGRLRAEKRCLRADVDVDHIPARDVREGRAARHLRRPDRGVQRHATGVFSSRLLGDDTTSILDVDAGGVAGTMSCRMQAEEQRLESEIEALHGLREVAVSTASETTPRGVGSRGRIGTRGYPRATASSPMRYRRDARTSWWSGPDGERERRASSTR